MKFDVIIIGGGAAGLFCAIEAGKRGRKVLVIEHNQRVGRKIIISGGGRCNFTNLHAGAENFISQNPHFCKSALAGFTPLDFVDLVKKYNIDFYEKKLGQLFCTGSSLQIVEMLLTECKKANVEIRLDCSVRKVSRSENLSAKRAHDSKHAAGSSFMVETNQVAFSCETLVIACGGLSIPKIGASDFGYRVARQFGLKIIETRPALVSFIFQNDFPAGFRKLAGISLDVNISVDNTPFRENILFTHRGLSGPAILQISSYWKPGKKISIDLLPDADPLKILLESKETKKNLANFLSELLPSRFAEVWTNEHFESKPLKGFSKKELGKVAEKLSNWEICISETEGYAKAEVTAGGVSTDELSSKTMESKRVKGLYFIGEVVDVTGWLGGYNFQWAWSSGFAAGQAV
jgi:predicted Rossmann fold flavoprotein